MILKRVAKGMRNQDWFVVFIEILIVVVGIFIGLQVDEWNEASKQEATTKTYYLRIIEDLHSNDISRLSNVEYLQRTKQHATSALNSLANNPETLGSQFIIDLYQATQVWPYNIQRATYDELLSGNIAKTIPDVKLRLKLSNYYLQIDTAKTFLMELTAYRENIRGYIPHDLQSYVRENCGDAYDNSSDYDVVTLKNVCVLKMAPETSSNAVRDILTYSDLKKDLTYQISDNISKIDLLEDYIPPIQPLVKYLDELGE